MSPRGQRLRLAVAVVAACTSQGLFSQHTGLASATASAQAAALGPFSLSSKSAATLSRRRARCHDCNPVLKLRGGSAPAQPSSPEHTELDVDPANSHEKDAATAGTPVVEHGEEAVQQGGGLQESAVGEVRGGFIGNVLARMIGIERHELRKFLAMSIMMFAIIYVFTMTRDTKDTLVVTNCGAEAIAFLKVYGVLPAATLFMVGYNALSNRFSHRALFRLTIVPFFAFYGLFAYVLYPMRDVLHRAPEAHKNSGHGLTYIHSIIDNWMYSLYYIVSELWGSAGVPLLFWTCANDVTPIAQAKRMYPLFGLLGNLAPIVSGQTSSFVSRYCKKACAGDPEAAFEQSVKILTGISLGAGALIMTLYEWIQHMSVQELKARGANEGLVEQKLNEKPKMGLLDSLRFLAKSEYLRYIGLLVVSYGLAMEFTEIVWKALVKLAYPNKADYLNFMGWYSTIVGTATFLVLVSGKGIIKHLGWEFGAMSTPFIMAVFSLPFFGYLILGNVKESHKALMWAVGIGYVQNVLSKATKYALFDPTKEMAYIPLDKDSKVKGKAAIDVLGARLGKSGGALAQQGLVVLFGSILSGAPVLAAMFYLVMAMWTVSVLRLGKLFHHRSAEAEHQDKLEIEASQKSHAKKLH